MELFLLLVMEYANTVVVVLDYRFSSTCTQDSLYSYL